MAEIDLKQKTKSGIYWNAASNFASKGMQFVFSIILARILVPSDYGVIGMLSIFITLVQLFIDSGFSQAIITNQKRTQKDLSTAFFFNIGIGIIGYLILYLASPWIACFYNMPILSSILKVTGVGVIINSLNIVQVAHYSINLDFKTPAKISIICNLFTGCLGIYLAYKGFGVWALVFQSLGGSLLSLILNWINVRWIPSFEFSKESFQYMWNYGSKVLGSSIVSTTYDNIQPLIIGKFFSPTALGLFARAQGFATLPSSNISGILNGVTFPLLSKINGDTKRLANVYRQLIRMSAYIVFPLMIGFAALADPIVKILLPEKWYECIPMLQILCFSLIWHPISAVNLNLLKAAKKADVVLRLEMIKKPVGLLMLFISIPFGIIAMCIANLIVCIFAVIINTIMTSRALNVRFIDQLKDLLPITIHSIIMGILVYITTYLPFNHIIITILAFSVGAIYYLIASFFFMKNQMQNAIYMIKK